MEATTTKFTARFMPEDKAELEKIQKQIDPSLPLNKVVIKIIREWRNLLKSNKELKIINLKLNDMNSGNRISVFCVLIILSTIIIFTSCEIKINDKAVKEYLHEFESTTDNIEEKIYGTWEYKISMNETEFSKFDGEETLKNLPENMGFQYSEDGELSFLKGKKYNAEANYVIEIIKNGRSIILKYHHQETGSWKLASNFIAWSTENSQITPLNDIAEKFQEEVLPDLEDENPISCEIVSIDETFMILKDQDSFPITYNKK